MGFGASVASISLGASIIEKHQVLKQSKRGVDSAFSLEPNEFKVLVKEIKCEWQSLGKIKYGPTKEGLKSLKYRRSIYFVKELKKGEKIELKHLQVVKSFNGPDLKYLDFIIGKKVKINIKKNKID